MQFEILLLFNAQSAENWKWGNFIVTYIGPTTVGYKSVVFSAVKKISNGFGPFSKNIEMPETRRSQINQCSLSIRKIKSYNITQHMNMLICVFECTCTFVIGTNASRISAIGCHNTTTMKIIFLKFVILWSTHVF